MDLMDLMDLMDWVQNMTFHDWLLLAYGAAILGGYIWMIKTRRRGK